MNSNANVNPRVGRLVRTALLVAIIFLLAFTPLGYLVIGPIAATTIQMPVIIGAVLMGPGTGAVLGFFFGLWHPGWLVFLAIPLGEMYKG